MHPSELYQPRYFRLAPEHRRCAVYLLVGAVLVVGAVRLVGAFVRRQPGFHEEAPGGFVIGAFFVALLVGAAFFILRWQIRVDQRGIATRWFFSWDVWPWEAFQDGRIRQGLTSYSYVWPEKPWWRRRLTFVYLKSTDAEYLVELCRTVWVPPPELEVPPELTVRYGLGKTVRFSPGGVCLGAEGWDPDYRWSDVTELRIVRFEHDRRDFQRLEIFLADRTVKLYLQKGSPNWRGAEAESIAALLQRHVPPERTLVAAMRGPPKSSKEADYRLEELRKRRRQNRNARRHGLVLALFCLVLAALSAVSLFWRGCVAVLMYAPLMGVLWWRLRIADSRLAKEEEELKNWRSEMSAGRERV